MGQIKVEKNVGGIEGLAVITPTVHGDDRGYFMETFNQRDMMDAGFSINFVQDNQSSSTKGVFVVYTFKSIIHKLSWFVLFAVAFLMLLLTFVVNQRPMVNGMALN